MVFLFFHYLESRERNAQIRSKGTRVIEEERERVLEKREREVLREREGACKFGAK